MQSKISIEKYRTSKKGRRTSQDYRLRKTYNITLEKYESMFNEQGGVCFICKKPETRIANGKPTLLTVDHNHTCCPGAISCGKCVRRLLCHGCNASLGLAGNSPDRLRQMAYYLELFNKRTESGGKQ